ncbi:related to rab geranylgeranyl transferase component A [Lecanosticta acicola]|uniref:Rab proteins geranylgeranyltransferase n=1 Tax=Lecanosticta acicola TaxID=111012 RepID=A0AAI8YUH7_9PEZI|nr:related to rab geranylgeranyl transferase component A [Lecanosticta acicola]
MDTLDGSSWDVVISGTGLPQSLLALALSRSDRTVLHVDRNDYYGSDEAAFSLSEAEAWAERHAGTEKAENSSFSHAAVTKAAQGEDGEAAQLSHARAYSVALAPQLIYSRSNLLPALVSSKTHGQLDFQAVGSWFVVHKTSGQTELTRVPGGREDIFQDGALDLKAKRSLMKFLRFVANFEEQQDTWREDSGKPFSAFLSEKFGLPLASHAPILALTLSSRPLADTTVESALPRIAGYLRGIGLFGPGFGALLPKWGGLAEIGQVACRAGAVGGAVYVLNKGIADVQHDDEFNLTLRLGGSEKVTSKWLAGTQQELPGASPTPESGSKTSLVSRSIAIVSSTLGSLFPLTSEGGVTPAGAVVLIEPSHDAEPPVHILAHSSESGECPAGQCVLYASVAQAPESGFDRLDHAIKEFLSSTREEPKPAVLWCMKYQQRYASSPSTPQRTGPLLVLHNLSSDLALEDSVLEDVKAAWQQITNDDETTFMKFEAREGTAEDEETFE